MREMFKGFYDVTPEEEKNIFESDKTIFVFDTNCFFNLYRCEDESRKDFILVVEKIKERLWFPFQVCLEYQRNRISTIKGSLSEIQGVQSEFHKILEQLNKLCSEKSNVNQKYKTLHNGLCSLRDKIKTDIHNFIDNDIKPRLIDNDYISSTDAIRNWLDELVESNIGVQLTKDEVDRINKDGEFRYKNKVGPGWGDEKKEKEHYFNGVYYKGKYGDLYLWKEMLKKASDEDIENIVFITNDEKEDWWYKLDGEQKAIGSLEVLKTEMINAGLKNFKMYNQPVFLKKSQILIPDLNINESTINDFEKINEATVSNIILNKSSHVVGFHKYDIKPTNTNVEHYGLESLSLCKLHDNSPVSKLNSELEDLHLNIALLELKLAMVDISCNTGEYEELTLKINELKEKSKNIKLLIHIMEAVSDDN